MDNSIAFCPLSLSLSLSLRVRATDTHASKTLKNNNRQVNAAQRDLNDQVGMTNVMRSGVGGLGNLFPKADELIFKIKKYRNRDSIVIACVCALCLFLMFIYWWSKE